MIQGFLSEFYQLTVDDPLFSAEGLDLDNTEYALKQLEEVTSNLQIINQTLPGRLYFFLHPLTSMLHPFRFLRSFLKSEKIRRQFLVCPCLPHAREIIQTYYETVQSLEKDLLSYRSACLNAQKETLKKFPGANAYNFHKSKVSFINFMDCINLMLRNAQVLRKEVESRNKKLLFSIQKALSDKREDIISDPCSGISLKVDSIQESNNRIKLSKELLKFVKWADQGRDYMYYLKQQYGVVKTELIGPISYKLAQFDGQFTSHKFFVSLVKDRGGTLRGFFAILADQYHFLELSEDKYKFYADIFIYEPLIKRGIPYWYQPATSFYFTSDLTYYADLATIVDLKRRPFLNRARVLSEKSSMLDLLVWNSYFHNLSYLKSIQARLKAGKKLASWHYLLVGRSYASLYYLPFNKSVWRLKEQPNFLGTPSKQEVFYLTLNQLPQQVKEKWLQKIFEGGRIRAEDVDKLLASSKK